VKFRRLADLIDRGTGLTTALRLVSRDFVAPTSISLDAGTSSDSVSDIQVLHDGNVYTVDEAAATPGTSLSVYFSNVVTYTEVFYDAYYGGQHYMQVQLYNYTDSAWETFHTFEPESGSSLRSFPVPSTDYQKSGVVIVRFYHPSNGNAADDFFVGWVAIR